MALDYTGYIRGLLADPVLAARYGSERGYVNGLELVSVGYGTTRQEHMYYLQSSLPFHSALLGQKYATADDAKRAAHLYVARILNQLNDGSA